MNPPYYEIYPSKVLHLILTIRTCRSQPVTQTSGGANILCLLHLFNPLIEELGFKKKKKVEIERQYVKDVKFGARQSWIHTPALAPTSYGTLSKAFNLCLTSLNFSFLPYKTSVIIPSVLA